MFDPDGGIDLKRPFLPRGERREVLSVNQSCSRHARARAARRH